MSRSFRKTPTTGFASDSDKASKQQANRKLRVHVRSALSQMDELMPLLREVSDEWDFEKDGKTSFDPSEFPDLMRK